MTDASSPTASPSAPASSPTRLQRPDLRIQLNPASSMYPCSSQDASYSPTSAGDSPSPSTPSTAGTLLTPSDTCMSPIYPPSNSFHVSLKPQTSLSYTSTPSSSQGSHVPGASLPPLPYPITRSTSFSVPPSTSSSTLPSARGPGSRARFPSLPSIDVLDANFRSVDSAAGPAATVAAGGRATVSHPYARLHAKNAQEGGTSKRRRMWNHALEKSVFTPQELSTIGAPQRRTIYTASMEAHIDALHAQLLEYALFPVPFEKLEPYRGLNSKTAKSMVAGLQKDLSDMKVKQCELQRTNHALRSCIAAHERRLGRTSVQPQVGITLPGHVAQTTTPRRHSLGNIGEYPYGNMFGGAR
ncbi:hypothetical protein BXZ70DRAFT_1006393 [Cristinia sonorae]|uniref:Uncharacterized protein n=1 Tax=Cristinia sonorae TaxID=1940300 RepID=A0A8K0URK8_9AGAR|nr:hypothetical protein BXZ70DRAFT_1006393 [Cristinia sonorae]